MIAGTIIVCVLGIIAISAIAYDEFHGDNNK